MSERTESEAAPVIVDGRETGQPRLWWQDGVIYQIYPRSFQDSNGDGVGDLAGILSRLDYLVDLGVDAIWISPFYPSPMADFGYDVSNYCGVDPLFGTLADFDLLIAGAHARGLKLILDFVPNHTSDRHPWFLESRSSRDNPKRDWYLWQDSHPDGGLPNNWMSHFGGPAWTLDPVTGQYYCHSFLAQQPDLNWRNPEVRDAMYAAMRFWLDRGVDGFRMDVLWLLIKDDQFRDNPPNPEWTPGTSSEWSVLPVYTANRPEVHEIVAAMRALLDSYEGKGARVLIGEIYLPLPDLVKYYGNSLQGAQMPFNFQLIQTPWNADALANVIRTYERLLPSGAWPNYVLGNHDQPRLASRIGTPQARVAAMLLLTLRGTPTLYNGDELGMPNAVVPPAHVQDPAEKNQPGMGRGRDPERSPMIWDTTSTSGFTTGSPWLPLVEDHAALSVATQRTHPASILALYRRLLALRRTTVALQAGIIEGVTSTSGTLAFCRVLGDQRMQVLLNLTTEHQTVPCSAGKVILTTFMDGEGGRVGGQLVLEASEGVLVELD